MKEVFSAHGDFTTSFSAKRHNKHKHVGQGWQKGTFLVLVSQVLLNKVSQDRWSLAVLMPLVHMEASITATQHCSCTVLLVGGGRKGTGVVLTFQVI